MVIGVIVGIIMGPEASMFKPLGDLFIQLIKMLVVPLVLVSIISGASALGETKSAGLIGGLSIVFMIITTAISIVLALFLGELFEPGVAVNRAAVETLAEGYEVAQQSAPQNMNFWDTVIGMIPANPIQALTEGIQQRSH